MVNINLRCLIKELQLHGCLTIGTPFVQIIFNLSNFAIAKLVTIYFAFARDKGQSEIKRAIEKKNAKRYRSTNIEIPILKKKR